VPGDARCAQLRAEDPLLADAERVDATAAELERGAAALVDDVVAADLVRMVLAEPVRAQLAAGLLVRGEDEQQLAGRRPPAIASEAQAGGELARDLALHVECSAPPDHSVCELGRPRVARPLGGVGADGVDVAEQGQGRAFARAAQARDEVRALGLGREQLALESGLGEELAELLLERALVPRRVDGVDADQPLQQLRRVGSQLRRRLRCRTLRHAEEVRRGRRT
jgi:hypothetical protein